MGTYKIGRKALYQRVWAVPMWRLAPEYGVSDVGLAKVCKRNQIPRPLRGYWARLAVGQKPAVVALPQPNDDREVLIRSFDPIDPAFRKPRNPPVTLTPVPVPDDLRHPHPLVRWTRVRFDGGDKDEYGRSKPSWGCLYINVTKANLYRALRIMNGVLAECERRGWSVSVPEGANGGTTVTIDGADVCVRLSELTQLRELTEQEKALAQQPEFRWRHGRPRIVNGNLGLWISTGSALGRRSWNEGKRAPLEKLLPRFMAGLAEAGVIQKRVDEARAQAEEEKWRIEVERMKVAEEKRLEQERVDKLVSKALAWHSRRFLTLYVDDVESRHPAVSTTGAELDAQESEFRQWLAWAREQANRLDPLDPCKYFAQRPNWGDMA